MQADRYIAARTRIDEAFSAIGAIQAHDSTHTRTLADAQSALARAATLLDLAESYEATRRTADTTRRTQVQD